MIQQPCITHVALFYLAIIVINITFADVFGVDLVIFSKHQKIYPQDESRCQNLSFSHYSGTEMRLCILGWVHRLQSLCAAIFTSWHNVAGLTILQARCCLLFSHSCPHDSTLSVSIILIFGITSLPFLSPTLFSSMKSISYLALFQVFLK